MSHRKAVRYLILPILLPEKLAGSSFEDHSLLEIHPCNQKIYSKNPGRKSNEMSMAGNNLRAQDQHINGMDILCDHENQKKITREMSMAGNNLRAQDQHINGMETDIQLNRVL